MILFSSSPQPPSPDRVLSVLATMVAKEQTSRLNWRELALDQVLRKAGAPKNMEQNKGLDMLWEALDKANARAQDDPQWIAPTLWIQQRLWWCILKDDDQRSQHQARLMAPWTNPLTTASLLDRLGDVWEGKPAYDMLCCWLSSDGFKDPKTPNKARAIIDWWDSKEPCQWNQDADARNRKLLNFLTGHVQELASEHPTQALALRQALLETSWRQGFYRAQPPIILLDDIMAWPLEVSTSIARQNFKCLLTRQEEVDADQGFNEDLNDLDRLMAIPGEGRYTLEEYVKELFVLMCHHIDIRQREASQLLDKDTQKRRVREQAHLLRALQSWLNPSDPSQVLLDPARADVYTIIMSMGQTEGKRSEHEKEALSVLLPLLPDKQKVIMINTIMQKTRQWLEHLDGMMATVSDPFLQSTLTQAWSKHQATHAPHLQALLDQHQLGNVLQCSPTAAPKPKM